MDDREAVRPTGRDPSDAVARGSRGGEVKGAQALVEYAREPTSRPRHRARAMDLKPAQPWSQRRNARRESHETCARGKSPRPLYPSPREKRATCFVELPPTVGDMSRQVWSALARNELALVTTSALPGTEPTTAATQGPRRPQLGRALVALLLSETALKSRNLSSPLQESLPRCRRHRPLGSRISGAERLEFEAQLAFIRRGAVPFALRIGPPGGRLLPLPGPRARRSAPPADGGAPGERAAPYAGDQRSILEDQQVEAAAMGRIARERGSPQPSRAAGSVTGAPQPCQLEQPATLAAPRCEICVFRGGALRKMEGLIA